MHTAKVVAFDLHNSDEDHVRPAPVCLGPSGTGVHEAQCLLLLQRPLRVVAAVFQHQDRVNAEEDLKTALAQIPAEVHPLRAAASLAVVDARPQNLVAEDS